LFGDVAAVLFCHTVNPSGFNHEFGLSIGRLLFQEDELIRLLLGFCYAERDEILHDRRLRYTCPAGAKLTKAKRRADHTEDFDFYRHLSACFTCPLKSRCTPTELRRVKRWVNEGVLDRMQDRLYRMPAAMGVRRQTVEHPFGTLKAWMGATHFLTRTLDKVRTEMSLHVLAYNLKRMIAIFGAGPLMAAIRA
jgi:hypothetical protein